MAGQDDFADNPFLRLDATLFPDMRQKTRSAVAPGNFSRPLDDLHSVTDWRDRDLFLAAVERLSRSRPAHAGRGFAISDQCRLPRLAATVKKKRQRLQNRAAPAAEPAAPRSDADLFLEATGGASPLGGGGRDVARVPLLGAPPALGQISLQDFMEGRLEFAVSNLDEYFEGHVVGLDELTMNKLRAGGFSPEAHVDLHGLNSLQAFETLRQFFRSAWYKSLRCLLVVPGRGRNSPDGMGVLRAKLQLWLTQEPFKRLVLAFCTAQPHDGGPGSVYVLLRKYRKKGRIYWERMPADADLY